jgi:DNA repair exonuclease SbcCD ATPase subunit
MSHFRLTYLEVEGFRSIVERQRVEFPDKGMILISGKYKGSLVSSGSGKSSIIEAIAFALDISNIPATDLKSWYANRLYVKLGLTDGKTLIEVERNPKMNLYINGENYSELSVGAKEKLYELLGLQPEILSQVAYRPQREKGMFLNYTDGELKKFLTKTLKLESIESQADSFNKKASFHEAQIISAMKDIENYTNLLKNATVSEEEIAAAEAQLVAANKKVAALSGNKPDFSREMAELDSVLRNLNSELNAINAEIVKVNSTAMKIEQIKNENQQIRSNIMSLKGDIAKLMESMCPTCEREWKDKKQLQLIKTKENQINDLLERMKANIEYITNSEPILDSKTILNQKIVEIQNQQYQVNLKKQEMSKKIGEANAPLSMAIQAQSAAQSNYNSLLNRKNTYTAIKEKIDQAERSLIENQKEAEINLSAAKVLGKSGFLAFIFEETLVAIEARSNDMIKNIPNIENFLLEISTTKQTKTTKTSKEEIKKAILKNGFEVSFKSLSGGQKAAMELCTDLSTSKEIKQKSGAGIGWILLDEAMDGLGTVEKQAALEIIKDNFDGQVFIVDHATEIKESFTQTIEVEYDGKTSTITSS